MAYLVRMKITERIESLPHNKSGFSLIQVLLLSNVIKQLSAFTDPKYIRMILVRNSTYSVIRKQILSVSHVSCNLMMLGWSNVFRMSISFWNAS